MRPLSLKWRMLARAAAARVVRLLRHSPAGFSPARHASGGPSDGRTNAVLLRNIELAARARDLDRVRSLLAASENVPSLAAEVEASQQRTRRISWAAAIAAYVVLTQAINLTSSMLAKRHASARLPDCSSRLLLTRTAPRVA